MKLLAWVTVLFPIALAAGWYFDIVYVIDQRQYTLRSSPSETSLIQPDASRRVGWAIPLYHRVTRLPAQIMLDSAAPDTLFASDRRALLSSWTFAWRIADPATFAARAGSVPQGRDQLAGLVNASAQAAAGQKGYGALLADTGTELAASVLAEVRGQARELGAELLGVFTESLQLMPAEEAQIFSRLRDDLLVEAERLRAGGTGDSIAVMAAAAREAGAILAEGYREAQETRGGAEAAAVAIRAGAAAKNPELHAWWRSLSVLSRSLDSSATLVISPRLGFLP